jgi:hypothetical protein
VISDSRYEVPAGKFECVAVPCAKCPKVSRRTVLPHVYVSPQELRCVGILLLTRDSVFFVKCPCHGQPIGHINAMNVCFSAG